MSKIAELRKLLQDLIAPDLKALNVEMKNSAELSTARHNEVKSQIAASEARTEANLAVMDSKTARIEGKVDLLIERLEIDKRLARIESIQPPTSTEQTA